MRHGSFISTILYTVTLSCIYVLSLAGCGVNDVCTGAGCPTSEPEVLTIITSSLPDGTVNQPYSKSVSGSGGTTPYTWSVTPALPADLSLDKTTGAITGTPVAEGTSSHTFTLTDSTVPPQSVHKSLTLRINTTPPVLSITTTSLPDGDVGRDYDQAIQATGGTGALTWSIVAGTLPQNLSLNATTGVISGRPTVEGTSSFTVRVADTAGQAATQALSILINSSTPPNITTTTLPGGTVGEAYNETLQATGGTGTLVWSLFGGSLPAGLTLTSAGTISGTPTTIGTSIFTVIVTDALAQSATQSLSIAVSTALTITTTSLPTARVGHSYSKTLQRAGGVSPFIWSVTPALPTGLSLNTSNGKISGTPAAGTVAIYSLTFTVQDSSTPMNQTASKALTLTITP